MEPELIKRIESLQGSEGSEEAISDCVSFLRRLKYDKHKSESCHGSLCSAMISSMKTAGSQSASHLLSLYGPAQTLRVIYANISQSELSVSTWLSHQLVQLISSGGLTALLLTEVIGTSSTLSPAQEQLVGVVCRIPDYLANRLGRQLSRKLLPQQYFATVGNSIADCLKELSSLSKFSDRSLHFLSAVIGRASVLGHRESVLHPLISLLEHHVIQDPVWRCVSHGLFSHVPTAGLEGIIETLVQTITPSLLPPFPLHSLLGDLVITNQKAKFILTHKLILVRVLSSPNAVYNLIGYLTATNMLGKSLDLALGVWSDQSTIRHMDSKHHLWISKVIVLGVNCLREGQLKELKPSLQRLTMTGIEAHIDSPLQQTRHVGMTVGEYLMNTFNPSDSGKSLKFDYELSEEVKMLKDLSRPLTEQQKDLKSVRSVMSDVTGVKSEVGEQRYREGMVTTVECSDNDSDDDLPAYSMSDDTDVSVPRPPQYLRSLLQGFLSSKDPQRMEASLKVAEKLIRSEASDLNEVCVELTKVLLHLSDSYSIPDFHSLRLDSLVALTVTCPKLVTPYLTTELYTPHYNIRQRIDILEVIGTSAVELSRPRPSRADQTIGHGNKSVGRGTLKKPWEVVIEERLKAKTRVISKGRTHTPPRATPNRFADVAPLFFFPLMTHYDKPLNTVNLLGQDSLVLGNLLYTLGTVMYAVVHAPVAPAMGVALMDFLWALRYHSAVYVRQGVLFSLAMIFSATPSHTLLSLMDGGVGEAIQWIVGVAEEDADEQCRTLARHALSVFDSTMKMAQEK